jgi:restriction endonuclease Mrr
MKVAQTQQIAESAVSRPAERAEKPDSSAFKAALAKASTETNGATTEKAEVTLRKGEEAVAVEGHAYSEITKGAREGMYVNTSGNVRHGEAFVLVRKNGKEYHIYGSGKDRLVVGFHMPKADGSTPTTDKKDEVDTSDLELRKGEDVKPVEGHAYAEITKGAREGMYVNTSGNSRHGEAFVLVRKHGVEYHIYGTGKDREVVALEPRDD